MGSQKRVLLHVGMLKTGTTSLQTFLRKNRESLAAEGIGYYLPKYIARNAPPNASFLCWQSLAEAKGDIPHDPAYEKEMASFSEYAKSFDTLILSEEVMSEFGITEPAFWDTVKKNLVKMLDPDTQIDVIIFIRRQDDWILSRWKQHVLNFFLKDKVRPADIPDFASFLNTCKSRGLMNYDKVLEPIENEFGQEHVTVCAYPTKHDVPFDVVKAFTEAAGIVIPKINKQDKLHENQSISMRAVNALLVIKQNENRNSSSQGDIYRAAKTFSELYPDEQAFYPMNRQERLRFLSGFKSSNERLSVAYNHGIPFFTNEIRDYCEWRDDPALAQQDAATILKLATVSNKTTQLLLRQLQNISKESKNQ